MPRKILLTTTTISLYLFFCKFRISNFQLPVVKGRYNNIPRHHQYCEICEENQLGDEYHILLECKNEQIEKKPFKVLVIFVSLFQASQNNEESLVNLCNFIIEIRKILNKY